MTNVQTFTLHVGIGHREIVLRNLSRVAVKRYRDYYNDHYNVSYIFTQ